MHITLDNPQSAPQPAGPYSEVARIDLGGGGALLFLAGQVSLDEEGNVAGGDDMAAQSRIVLEAVQALLKAHGATLDHVVNIRTFLTDMSRLGEYAAVRREFLTGTPPTSTTVEVSGLFRPGALIEVEVVAAVPPAPAA
ncbi:RidA family protein [Streptomyces sp. H10-C2]|uniref:RidA family protein n=1 Tax=unclassified Streptomyces TaxID=2593676 RepID=UPI0024B89C1D|nr:MULTISPECIES: RidA family protein [unclassified Streptomyces]MDJ0345052.1 RidA family protein [Streptomyces sp. PH10-H1]MDJ0370829.1 RidA family protein [Streptomyces sp. H10-C2]